MEKILISRCLLGINCKYNGKNNYIDLVEKLKERYELISICPENDGGLSIPRAPSERVLNKVISINGVDVTNEYNKGANIALNLAKKYNITKAILKDGSPSCGKNYIYDGSFSHTKIKALGVTTELLTKNNIKVYTENEIEKLLEDSWK